MANRSWLSDIGEPGIILGGLPCRRRAAGQASAASGTFASDAKGPDCGSVRFRPGVGCSGATTPPPLPSGPVPQERFEVEAVRRPGLARVDRSLRSPRLRHACRSARAKPAPPASRVCRLQCDGEARIVLRWARASAVLPLQCRPASGRGPGSRTGGIKGAARRAAASAAPGLPARRVPARDCRAPPPLQALARRRSGSAPPLRRGVRAGERLDPMKTDKRCLRRLRRRRDPAPPPRRRGRHAPLRPPPPKSGRPMPGRPSPCRSSWMVHAFLGY